VTITPIQSIRRMALRRLISSKRLTRTSRAFHVSAAISADALDMCDTFSRRHLGPTDADAKAMLASIGFESLDAMVTSTVPAQILTKKELDLQPAMTEIEALGRIRLMADKNKVMKSFIGQGYYDTIVPPVILRNVLENPGWYTAYTPYQAEISQGRLEMLLNFQTLVCDLTGLPMAVASLLDESTAAAEAMQMCFALKGKKGKKHKFFVSDDVHPQTIGLLETRAGLLGIELVFGKHSEADFSSGDYCGSIVQYPNTYGSVESPGESYKSFTDRAHDGGAMVIAATDLMALTKISAPSTWGADIAVGSAQRFGVPMGFGGPHAGFLATSDTYSRKMPGRIIGVTIDTNGKPCLRMAMQTREQHIRRDKATSNICTAQALLANMAASYAVYHGPEGLKNIAGRIHALARVAHRELGNAGFKVTEDPFFDTFTVDTASMGMTSTEVQAGAVAVGANVRVIDENTVGISMGEGIMRGDIEALLKSAFKISSPDLSADASLTEVDASVAREGDILVHPIFRQHHSETQMLRYLKALENRDLALNHSMISLGSCTMKLNATSEMLPVTWPSFCDIHPFAPTDQVLGYHELIKDLNKDLAEITGFAAVSAQPNSGATGEYAGLLTIMKYLKSQGEGHRNVCLIPKSAHGTNPASAAMAGMKVVVVDNDDGGNIDIVDLKSKIAKHADNLAAFMVTYPSTFGVFEEGIVEILDAVHDAGGQVYMDGANMNAQVGLTSPGLIGADVCHLNLHKTFCIPHGGGGPGVGSIGVAAHLAPFLPGHVVGQEASGDLCGSDLCVPKSDGAVAGAPFGSAAILPISWMYIKMNGTAGLKKATQYAILNANYMAARLNGAYDVLFVGKNGQCAHEFILDLRPLKASTGVTEEDVAKRLQDYGFHSPTMSWPVAGTLMIEPTESEDLGELDRFCDAMLAIRSEIDDIGSGRMKVENSPLRNAPHTMDDIVSEKWDRPYSREVGAYPAPWIRANKFWPTCRRVDNVYGDRNLVCTCPPLEAYMDEEEIKKMA
jgi:glycine dehydrogenase